MIEAPAADCARCPRLAAFRAEQRAAFPDWHNAPVPSFGPESARLLIVGLAPGLRGANRTGRPFTGDYAGDLLYATLLGHGLARGSYGADPADGLELVDCRIVNAVRCLPPQNKPTGAEIAACRPYLAGELTGMPNLRAVIALGRIAHESVVRALGERPARFPFAHAAQHAVGGLVLADSYHCSRYNTQTRRLTPAMFEAVFAAILDRLGAAPVSP
ncbi:MAG: uracil-DNA glycosylase [Alphaproteobacteria bacterium]|nr:uracil-DNA glycosylase [Alphaproteobacteria bacterium]